MDFSHDVVESEVHLFSGQLKISQQFREWCRANMVEMGGSGDIALIEFLLSLKSRSEIAEYIQEYFKEAPPDKLSVFISEFLKRKDSDPAQIKKERGGQKSKKKTSKKDSTKSSSNTVELEAVSSGASESHGLEATGSGKAASMRTREVKSKPKAKKQAKGQHIPADMLGFKSNVNFDSLYRGNSSG